MSALLALAPPTSRSPRARRRPVSLRPVPATGGAVPAAAPLTGPPVLTVPPGPAEPVQEPRPRDPFTEDVTPLRSLTGPAADPGRVCMSILQVTAEAMRGLRPLAQLARWVD